MSERILPPASPHTFRAQSTATCFICSSWVKQSVDPSSTAASACVVDACHFCRFCDQPFILRRSGRNKLSSGGIGSMPGNRQTTRTPLWSWRGSGLENAAAGDIKS